MKITKTALGALAIVLSSQSFATNEIQHDANQKRLESVVSVLDEGIFIGAHKTIFGYEVERINNVSDEMFDEAVLAQLAQLAQVQSNSRKIFDDNLRIHEYNYINQEMIFVDKEIDTPTENLFDINEVVTSMLVQESDSSKLMTKLSLNKSIYAGAVKCKAEPLTCEGNPTIGQQTLAQVEGIKNMILAEINRSTFQSEDLVIDDTIRAKAKASVKPNIENNLKLDELGLNIQRAATL